MRFLSVIFILLAGIAIGFFLSSRTTEPVQSPTELTNVEPTRPQPLKELTKLTPAHASTAGRRPKLTWSARGAEEYDVYLGLAAAPLVKIASNVSTTHVTPPNQLRVNRTYRWTVVAKNGFSEVSGPVWSFTTTSEPLAAQPHTQPAFRMFDSTLHTGKPDLSADGVERLAFLNSSDLWTWGSSPTQPDEITVRKVMSRFGAGDLVALDIEHWPVANYSGAPSVKIDANIAKLRRVANIASDQAPDVKLGYNALLPLLSYYAPTTERADWMTYWKTNNKRLEAVAEKVDVIFPSLFNFEPNQKRWVTYAKANIAEAKKYGKPVYVVLWHTYHGSHAQLAGEPIPPDFWKLQLETVRSAGANGVVIRSDQAQPWDENAPWWVETKEFIASLEQSTVSSTSPDAPSDMKVTRFNR